jgi:CHASE3 domain sensor protein
MNDNALYEAQGLFKQFSAAVELINASNEQAARDINTSARALGKNAQQLADGGEHLAQDVLEIIRTQGGQALSRGMDQTLDQFQRQMQQRVNQARELEQVLAQHRRGVVGLTRTALIVLVVGALLVAGGSIYVAYDRSRAIENAQFGQDVLQAINGGVINRCGGKLCVRASKARCGTARTRTMC